MRNAYIVNIMELLAKCEDAALLDLIAKLLAKEAARH